MATLYTGAMFAEPSLSGALSVYSLLQMSYAPGWFCSAPCLEQIAERYLYNFYNTTGHLPLVSSLYNLPSSLWGHLPHARFFWTKYTGDRLIPLCCLWVLLVVYCLVQQLYVHLRPIHSYCLFILRVTECVSAVCIRIMKINGCMQNWTHNHSNYWLNNTDLNVTL